jgi:hypothetical protein
MKFDHGMHIGLHLVFFGKTSVTYGSVCGHRAHGACGPGMGHTTWHMGRHWTYSRALRGKVPGHLLGSMCGHMLCVWAWDGAHGMAYGSALDG